MKSIATEPNTGLRFEYESKLKDNNTVQVTVKPLFDFVKTTDGKIVIYPHREIKQP
jgi:hypothetical protein